MWIEFGQRQYSYDENFMAVSNYAKNNQIGESFTKKITRRRRHTIISKGTKKKKILYYIKGIEPDKTINC